MQQSLPRHRCHLVRASPGHLGCLAVPGLGAIAEPCLPLTRLCREAQGAAPTLALGQPPPELPTEASSVPWQVMPGAAVPAPPVGQPPSRPTPAWLPQGLLQNRLLDTLFAPLG